MWKNLAQRSAPDYLWPPVQVSWQTHFLTCARFAFEQGVGTVTAKPELSNVKACVFDTFGTVVDWRSSVIAEATRWGQAKGLKINWSEFADRWRLGYTPAMDKVRKARFPGQTSTICSA